MLCRTKGEGGGLIKFFDSGRRICRGRKKKGLGRRSAFREGNAFQCAAKSGQTTRKLKDRQLGRENAAISPPKGGGSTAGKKKKRDLFYRRKRRGLLRCKEEARREGEPYQGKVSGKKSTSLLHAKRGGGHVVGGKETPISDISEEKGTLPTVGLIEEDTKAHAWGKRYCIASSSFKKKRREKEKFS